MQIVEAPNSLESFFNSKAIKLYITGSISLDKSENWIMVFIEGLKKYFLKDKNLFIFHPIRKDWNPEWGENEYDSEFRKQFVWELEAQGLADIVVMHFEHDALAPITLMEFGLNVGKDSRLIVHCPKGFWKKGNIDIICIRNEIKQAETLDDLLKLTIEDIRYLKKCRKL